MSIFVALLGPSGVGKTTVIKRLEHLHPGQYGYVKPYTTRPLRDGERDKVSIGKTDFKRQVREGEILLPNKLYGNWYGVPKKSVVGTLEAGQTPMLDWPVQRLEDLRGALLPISVLGIYLFPPSLDILKERLGKDGRDKDGARYRSGVKECEEVSEGIYPTIDDRIITDVSVDETANRVHEIIAQKMLAQK